MKQAKLSVIIPVYNAEDFLEQCLDSVLGQTLSDIEVFCIDDGSDDRSPAILEEYAAKDSRIVVMHQENKGAGTARNLGMEYASGEYVHFLDSDDYLELDAYEKMYSVAKKHNIDVIKTRVNGIDSVTGERVDNRHYDLSGLSSKDFNRVLRFTDMPENFARHICVVPWNGIYRREFLVENNIRFNSLVCVNDRSFYNHVIIKAKRIMIIGDEVVNHRTNIATSLIGRRIQNFDCHFESYRIISEQCAELADKHRAIVLSAEVGDTIAWYNKFKDDPEYGPAIEEKMAWFFDGIDINFFRRNGAKMPWKGHWDNFYSKRGEENTKFVYDGPKVSVIIPFYNGGDFLRECLDSVARQTLKDIEIICVDDGSTDNSLAIAREFEAKDKRFTVLTQENINAGAARNKGIAAAKGKYLSILDADDFFEKDMLQKAFDHAEKYQAQVTVFGSNQYIQETGKYKEMPWAVKRNMLPKALVFSASDIEKDRFRVFAGWAWDKLFLREYIQRNGLEFQSQRTTNDMFFVFSAVMRAERISVMKEVFVHQRKQSDGTLSVTREKSWTCFFNALTKVRAQMQEWGYWTWVEQDFVNYAVHSVLWNLSTLQEETRRQLYKKLNDEYLFELGITGRVNDYFYNQADYQKLLRVLALPYEQYYNLSADEEVNIKETEMHNERPKVTVLMPSYNVQPYIRECIESVLNQTLRDIEVICLDSCSTDGTLEILREYEASDSRVKVLTTNINSLGYKMNVGINMAAGEYIGIVETDDYIKPTMYEELCPIADKYDLDVLKADFCIFMGEGDNREFTYRPVLEDRKYIDYYNKVVDPFEDFNAFKGNKVPWAGVYKTSFLRENHVYYNETKGASFQDNGFWFLAFSSAHKVMFYPKPFYMLRRDNPNSSMKSDGKVYCICDEYDYVRKELRKRPEAEQRFVGMCALARYNSYNWTVNRVADEYKLEFLRRFSCDFRRLKVDNELDRSLFNNAQWTKLNRIIDDPEEYYYTEIAKSAAPKKEAAKAPAAPKSAAPTAKSNTNTGNTAELSRKLKASEAKVKYLNNEIKAIRSSWTYRLGSFITWLPRKVRGFFRCLKENGFGYTMSRVKYHIFKKKSQPKTKVAEKPKAAPAKPVQNTAPAKPVQNTAPAKPAQGTVPAKLERQPLENKRYNNYDYYMSLEPEQYVEEIKLWYKCAKKVDLDLDHPKTFNEKMQWLKIYDSTPIKTLLADKYLVRDWVKEIAGEEYLVPLLGVWDSFDEIDFDKLPDQFVLKTNHGSAWNIIVKDKSQFDKEDAKKKMDEWMKLNFAFVYGFQLHYMNIPPKIIAEKYIEEMDQVYDYKFMCFNGEVKFIWVDTDRFTRHRRTLFTPEWERRKETINKPAADFDIPRPKTFDKMLELATKMCQGFAHVRVDFYEVDGKLYFGEMTFTSASGVEMSKTVEFNYEMGDWLVLPEKSPIPRNMFKK